MKVILPIAALAAGVLTLGACADDQTASDDSMRDTQEAHRGDTDYYPPSSTTTTPDATSPSTIPPGTGTTNPDGTTIPDDDGIPPAAPGSPNTLPPTVPPT